MVKRTLHHYGDRELWYAEADDRTWQLPLWVEWRHDKENDLHYAHVFPPGICFYYNQLLALNALLQAHDVMGRSNQWLIPRRICEAILHKAPGITVLRYYRWPDQEARPIEERPPISTSTKMEKGIPKQRASSFVSWLSEETKISSSIINAVLSAVGREAPTWLVERRQPLDLGFCRLVAVPFRANWKEIIAFKAKNLKLLSLFRLPDDKRWDALEEVGLPGLMTSPHNVALRRGSDKKAGVVRIDYTIEAIPSDSFEKAVNKIEWKRIARGAIGYLAEFEAAVETLYESAAAALFSYLRKAGAPFTDVHGGRRKGVLGFVPVIGRKIKVRTATLNNLPVHITPSDSSFSLFGESSDPRLVQAPPLKMPEVPTLLPPAPDVRECIGEGDLGQPAADTGLLLSNGNQGVESGEPMLAESTDTGERLDGEGN